MPKDVLLSCLLAQNEGVSFLIKN
uniref:Uncharacterized protein n=1 Tax=Anguilla anguilla TaxID=7936 RepID=A0A0E9VDE4_ANGAN